VPAPPEKIARNGGSVRRTHAAHIGEYGTARAWTDNGTRLMRSVLQVKSMRGRAIHPTEKSTAVLDPLIRYACPPGGLVVDPFAGSGSTLDAARASGRRAIGIELREPYAEKAARRLDQLTLDVS
jgi:site-specific DNA-methyltransferase (adenine-specific)